MKKRYAQIGLGARHIMYRDAILDKYSINCELVALCDINPGRVELSCRQVYEKSGLKVKGYTAEQFEQMIKETEPDIVIVTTVDRTHHEYICRALEAGCDVITEKPMTVDEIKCQQIIDTEKKTGKKVRVTFNYRYSPYRTQIKDLLMSGIIGEVLSIDFHWLLNTWHGADYFRRWHRKKENSGGLMVHKATHHFDLVNWWISSIPIRVFASGDRKFYLPDTALRLGLTRRTERCFTCPETGCPFRLDIKSKEDLRQLYLDCEKYDRYYRDQCVFSEDIDIEDCVNVVVDYANGVKMSYSLNAFMAWEGYMICFNGTKGRLEHKCQESVYISGDGTVPGEVKKEGTWIRIYPLRRPAYEVPVWTCKGGHGGGDALLLEDLFSPSDEPDKYKRAADSTAGAWSILTGIAANISMKSGKVVEPSRLVKGIQQADFTEMPGKDSMIRL